MIKLKLGLTGLLKSNQEESTAFDLLELERAGKIKWNPKQKEAIELFKKDHVKTLVLFGGGRSGKTTVGIGLIFERCLSFKGHLAIIARQNFNALKRSIVDQTINGFYKRTFDIAMKQNLSSPAKITFLNNSLLSLAGIEGSNNTSGLDAHLGNEYGTIYLNETSQISFKSYKLLMTRANDARNPVKIIIDLNPTSKNHWVYKYFVEGVDPETDEPLPSEVLESFAVLQMNPADNLENLGKDYLQMIRAGGTANVRRFELGQWADFNENSIFPIQNLQWIDLDLEKEIFDYVSIGVDPAMTSKTTSDETGLVVTAMRRENGENCYYVLEDLSGRYTPEVWTNLVVKTYKRYKNIRAKINTTVVLETNQGGDTLTALLRVANEGINFPVEKEHETKDKVTRAMLISSLYEQKKVWHVQKFKNLENQMSAMGMDEMLDHDDRADAMIRSLSYLFKKTHKKINKFYE